MNYVIDNRSGVPFYRQIIELSEGREPNVPLGAWSAFLGHFSRELRIARSRSFKRGRPALTAGERPEAQA